MVDNAYTMMKELKEYAKENNVPIMHEEGIDFLTTFVIKYQVENVLEIGTAIGFSAISMALANPKLKITSIERDEVRYLEAVKNVKKFNLEDRITLLFKDAADVKLDEEVSSRTLLPTNKAFFEKFEKRLTQDGFIITDNMKFHGYVDKDESEIKNRNLRGLVRKIKDYRKFLEEHEDYKTKFYDTIGDGVAVSTKK